MESGLSIFEEMNIEKVEGLEDLITDQPICSEKEIPEEGLIIDLKSMQKKIVRFTKIKRNHKVFLIEIISQKKE